MTAPDYQYTNNWFEVLARPVWDQLLPQVKPSRVLEIGSFEGASTCYLIDAIAGERPLEIHCIDTWAGGIEHHQPGSTEFNMGEVEQRFNHNVRLAMARAKHAVKLVVHKGPSDIHLARLLADGQANQFDFTYVDASHQAPDVLCDAVLAFRLTRVTGVMAFDDYLWAEDLPEGVDPLRCPKIAVDAFTTLYARKVRILPAPLYQLYVRKTAE